MTWFAFRSSFRPAAALLMACLVTSSALAQAPAETDSPSTSQPKPETATDKSSADNVPSTPAPNAGAPNAGAPSTSAAAMPSPTSASPPEPRHISRTDLITSLTIFVLAIFIGFEVIAKVPPTLHTPLMSGSNAISGITIVGAVIVAGVGFHFSSFIGFLAVIVATINAVGGFVVTHRMLAMFKRK